MSQTETVPIPLFTEVYRNVDGVELRDETEYLMNGYTDDKGATHGRPGCECFLDLRTLSITGLGAGAKIDGLFWWEQQECLLVVSDGKVFKVTYPNQVATCTLLYGGDKLLSGNRVSFAQDGTYVFMANGGNILYTDGTSNAIPIASADAPTASNDVAYIDTYLVANVVGSEEIKYSNVGDRLTWVDEDRFHAMSFPDIVHGLKIYNREIYIFGPESTEFWESDTVSPFSRVPGGAIQVGCIAPKSIVVAADGLYWLNHNRTFVMFNGQAIENLSTPYDKEIEEFGEVADAVGDYVKIDGHQFIIWSFPSQQRTLVLNLNNKHWSEWGTYNTTNATYSHWIGGCYCYCPAWGLHIIGDRSNAVLYRFSTAIHEDNGASIRVVRRSGHIDYGTSKTKRNQELRFRAKRGHAATTNTPQLILRWRDNNERWSNEQWFSLGDQADTNLIVRLRRTGKYNTRQYEFICTEAVPVIFLAAEEDIEVLR